MIFLHIPGLKITQIKIPRNVVDVFCTITTWRHMNKYLFFTVRNAFHEMKKHQKRLKIQISNFQAAINKHDVISTIVSDWKPYFLFLHIPGLKITQIKIPRNVVDVFCTLTTWRHMKTSSLKRKDQTSFGFVYASILIKYNKNIRKIIRLTNSNI
jgi:hypothetical protein